MQLGLLMAAIVAGFFVVNFPFGKLFLGDAGAYFAGYLVATLAVMLPARNPEVSPWVSLLILGYPVTETVVSMVLRLRDKGVHPSEPDAAHLHHIVHRNWAHRVAEFVKAPVLGNAMSSLIMWALLVVALCSVWIYGLNSLNSMWFIALIVVFYLVTYRGILAYESSMQKD